MSHKTNQSAFLIIDDEFSIRENIKLIIRSYLPDTEIFEASDGNMGLEMLQHHADKIGVITLDINMPNQDGLSFLREKNKNEIWRKMNVVVISTEEKKSQFSTFKELGANYFCEKGKSNLPEELGKILLNLGFQISIDTFETLPSNIMMPISRFIQYVKYNKAEGKSLEEFHNEILEHLESSHIYDAKKLASSLTTVYNELKVTLKGSPSVKNSQAKAISLLTEKIKANESTYQKQNDILQLVLSSLFSLKQLLAHDDSSLPEMLRYWAIIKGEMHNLKGQVEPPILNGLFSFLNYEIMSIAQEFSDFGFTLSSSEIDEFIKIIDTMISLLDIESSVAKLAEFRNRPNCLTEEDKNKILEIITKINETGKIRPEITQEQVFNGKRLMGLVSAIIGKLNIFNVKTIPINYRDARVVKEELDKETLIHRLTDYETVRKEGPLSRFEYLFFSSINTPEEFSNLIGQNERLRNKIDRENITLFYANSKRSEKTVVKSREPKSNDVSVAIKLEELNSLYQNVENLTITKSRILKSVSELKKTKQNLAAEPVHELEESYSDLDEISQSMHETIVKAKQVPLTSIAGALETKIKELNKEKGKSIEFEQNFSKEALLDRSVVDRLSRNILSLIDNAFEHGFAGTSIVKGRILVKSERDEANNVIITIEDDGLGLNKEYLEKKALEKKYLDPHTGYSEQEIFNTIFLGGISTASSTSTRSGKGIGMWEIKKMVDDFGGRIHIEKVENNKGTRFVMEFPNSISIDNILLLEELNAKYGIPLRLVNMIIADKLKSKLKPMGHLYRWEVEAKKLGISNSGQKELKIILPVIPFKSFLLQSDSSEELDDNKLYNLLIIRCKNDIFGLLVDCEIEREEVVIKRFNDFIISSQNHIKDTPPFQTVTLLGDGTIVPIVNIDALISFLGKNNTAEFKEETLTNNNSSESTISDQFVFLINKQEYVIPVSAVQRVVHQGDILSYTSHDLILQNQYPFIKGIVSDSKVASNSFFLIDTLNYLSNKAENSITETEKNEIIVVKLDNGNFVGLLAQTSKGRISGKELTREMFEGENQIFNYLTSPENKRFIEINLDKLQLLPVRQNTYNYDNIDKKTESSTKSYSLICFNINEWKFAIPSEDVYFIEKSNQKGLALEGFKEYMGDMKNIKGNATSVIYLDTVLGLPFIKKNYEDKEKLCNIFISRSDDMGNPLYMGFYIVGEPEILDIDEFINYEDNKIINPIDPDYIKSVLCKVIPNQVSSNEESVFFELDLDKVLQKKVK
ncbi:MAG TPA: response regulator [Ignavibacteriaceae bacterium]|nr:response regulator [Ignavibacteriaceae bacterium]